MNKEAGEQSGKGSAFGGLNPSSGCVTFGKLFNLSEPQQPHPYNGNNRLAEPTWQCAYESESDGVGVGGSPHSAA